MSNVLEQWGSSSGPLATAALLAIVVLLALRYAAKLDMFKASVKADTLELMNTLLARFLPIATGALLLGVIGHTLPAILRYFNLG